MKDPAGCLHEPCRPLVSMAWCPWNRQSISARQRSAQAWHQDRSSVTEPCDRCAGPATLGTWPSLRANTCSNIMTSPDDGQFSGRELFRGLNPLDLAARLQNTVNNATRQPTNSPHSNGLEEIYKEITEAAHVMVKVSTGTEPTPRRINPVARRVRQEESHRAPNPATCLVAITPEHNPTRAPVHAADAHPHHLSAAAATTRAGFPPDADSRLLSPAHSVRVRCRPPGRRRGRPAPCS